MVQLESRYSSAIILSTRESEVSYNVISCHHVFFLLCTYARNQCRLDKHSIRLVPLCLMSCFFSHCYYFTKLQFKRSGLSCVKIGLRLNSSLATPCNDNLVYTMFDWVVPHTALVAAQQYGSCNRVTAVEWKRKQLKVVGHRGQKSGGH